MAFVKRTTQPNTNNKYYINQSYGGYNVCTVQQGSSGYVLPSCTGYAYGRFLEMLGDARCSLANIKPGLWYSYSSGRYDRGIEPQVGAILCLADPSGDGTGHLAVVEEVLSSSAVVISQSSIDSRVGIFSIETVHKSESGYVPAWCQGQYKFQGFIYCPLPNLLEDFIAEAEKHINEHGDWTWQTVGQQRGGAWCAAFMCACAKQIGVLDKIIPKTFACRTMLKIMRDTYGCEVLFGPHVGKNPVPRRGDLIFFRWDSNTDGTWNYCRHVGVVAEVTDSTVVTIEGNTGSGGSNYNRRVLRQNRKRQSKSIYAYARPKWGVASVSSSTPTDVPAGIPLYTDLNTRNDAIMREVCYVNSAYQPSIQMSGLRLSVINYTTQLSNLFSSVGGDTGEGVNIGTNVGISPGEGLSYNLDHAQQNVRIIFSQLTAAGLTASGAVGVLGNMMRESGCLPSAVNSNGGASGLCQWFGTRATNMKNYVGANWANNITGQVQFLLEELTTISQFRQINNYLRSCPNTLQGAMNAADEFCRDFEMLGSYRSSVSEVGIKYASEIWSKMIIQLD